MQLPMAEIRRTWDASLLPQQGTHIFVFLESEATLGNPTMPDRLHPSSSAHKDFWVRGLVYLSPFWMTRARHTMALFKQAYYSRRDPQVNTNLGCAVYPVVGYVCGMVTLGIISVIIQAPILEFPGARKMKSEGLRPHGPHSSPCALGGALATVGPR